MAKPVNVVGGKLSKVDSVGTMDTLKNINNIHLIHEVKDVQIKSERCPRINDESLIESWDMWKAASLALATVSAIVSYQSARKRYKIAKRYWNLAKSELDHFFDNYMPVEKQELAELKVMQIPEAEYDTARKGHTASIDPIYNNIYSQRQAMMDQYCLCPDPTAESKFLLAKNTIEGDLDNFSRRYAENLRQRRDDLRWDKRTKAANRGRNLASTARGFADLAQNFYGDYSDAMTSVAQGLSGIAGYMGSRRQTVYNESDPRRISSRAGPGGIQYTGGQQRAIYEQTTPNIGTVHQSGYTQGAQYQPEYFDDLNSNNMYFDNNPVFGIDNASTSFDPTMGFGGNNNGFLNA